MELLQGFSIFQLTVPKQLMGIFLPVGLHEIYSVLISLTFKVLKKYLRL